ncbi:MAG: ThuA domain-containing protein [Planctomycetota bacterium]|jgi:type 1 glutamine amidotransferase
MFAAAILVAGLGGSAEARDTAPLRVLVFTGRNNHDWRKTTPALKKIYEDSKRFVVELTDDPGSYDAADFAKYDVLVSNWSAFPKLTAREWGADTEKAFLDFVRGGKGFVLFHAASATFHSWPEFQDLIAATWGKGTGHGPYHAFKVTIAERDHPVTRGMSGFRTTDELWHRMATRPTMKVLCTAFSDRKQRGSGKDEPVVIHTKLGKGRCFHLVLGHDVRAMQNVGWRTLMLRGTEWAATGKVTIPIPGNWPTARAAAEIVSFDSGAALAATKSYKVTGSRKALIPVEKLVHHAATDPVLRKELAAKLAAMLDSDATADCRKFVCRQLSLIGSGPEVPALAKLLGDKDIALAARSALERIPGDEALAAMRSALPTATGPALVGLVNTLGERRDAAAAGAIAKHLAASDADTAAAAIDALGKIGGPEATRALSAAKMRMPAKLQPVLADALLRCADGMLAAGRTREAAAVYEQLSAAGNPRHVRIAAFPGLVACRKDGAAELILKALTGGDREMQLAAVRSVRGAGGTAFTAAISRELGRFPATVRAGVIAALGERGDAAALSAVAREAASEDQTVRRAAIVALGRLGDASTVALLARHAAAAALPEQRIARSSLARLRGEEIEPAMVRLLKGPEPKVRREVVAALAARGARKSVPALIEAGRDADRNVRKEAMRAVSALADVSACPKLVALLASRGSAGERREIENALVGICRRSGGDAGPVLAELGRATGPVRVSLLRVLGKLGGEAALSAVRSSLKSGSTEVATAAVRALAEWPDASVLPDLLAAARSAGTNTVQRVLALRGFAQLAAKGEDRSADKLVGLYAEAMALARGAQEKKALFGGLGKVAHPEAMKLAARSLADPALADEAGLAVVQIAGILWKSDRDEVRSALGKVLATAKAKEVRRKATEITLKLDKPVNLAIGATATSPDGLGKDGGSGGDRAAIDGNPATYWDEVDGKKLYRLVVTFKRPTEVSALAILGYQHHNYSPKDFDVLCDGKVVRSVRGAVYDNSKLNVAFPATRCKAVELKITGYYGQSPAIRELEIYNLTRPGGAERKGTTIPTNPGYAWRRTDTSLALEGQGGVVWQLNYKKEEGKPYFHPLGLTDGTVLTWLQGRPFAGADRDRAREGHAAQGALGPDRDGPELPPAGQARAHDREVPDGAQRA